MEVPASKYLVNWAKISVNYFSRKEDLLLEPAGCVSIRGNPRQNHLERDMSAPKKAILDFVNLTHTTARDESQDNEAARDVSPGLKRNVFDLKPGPTSSEVGTTCRVVAQVLAGDRIGFFRKLPAQSSSSRSSSTAFLTSGALQQM